MNSNNNIDKGKLQIATYATDIGKPLGNATVLITPMNERDKVIEELQTDLSGQTQIIDLPAPPLEYSQQPDEPMPYSEYDVSVLIEGYKPAVIQGVQILPDSLAYQNVNLFPREDMGKPVESIEIEQHTLYGTFPPKIPEEAVKPLPEGKGFVVLPKVVVPEFIVVHTGVPTNAKAPNYWIPFADYIKNVASCEIYSTWSDATIRANVFAILSFTLNRVYTEWYRGKGFNFTITNSTAYDQAFVYGRNIYRNISNIVDEIFTTFITKPQIKQPLFTQYCDGSRSACPGWLSQWGSKELGDRGYTALNILKYYYGQEIFLMQAEKVEGVPISYPGTPLTVGSTGPNVRTIQLQLNAISNNYPAIPKLKVDGIYGPLTKRSVEIFQEIFRLPVSGIVDYATWYQISNIFVAVTKLAEL